jgi:DNA-binding transcriptional regulator YiaG
MAVGKTKRRVRRLVSRRKAPRKASAKALRRAQGPQEGAEPKKARPRSRRKAVATRPTSLAEAYAKALKLSRQTGKAVRLVVGIRPDGAEKITAFEEDSAGYADQHSSGAGHSELDRALADARHRGQLRVAEVVAGPEMLSADAFAERLGTTRATVTAWRHKNRVLGLEGATRGFRFPDWQVGDDGKPFRVLAQLFDRLGGDAWAVYRFLVQHHPELGGMTGREALQKGRVDEVVEAAESVARAFA